MKTGRFDELRQHLDALVALYSVDGDKCVTNYLLGVLYQLRVYNGCDNNNDRLTAFDPGQPG